MGKLQTAIQELINNEYGRGIDGAKISRRLIEAGIEMMFDEGAITDDHAIVLDMSGKRDFCGQFSVIGYETVKPPMVPVYTAGMLNGGDGKQIPAERLPEMVAAIRWAGNQFDYYARQHFDKRPPQINKAEVNVEGAVKMFKSIDDAYTPPTQPSPGSLALESASLGAVEADSAALAAGSATAVMQGVQAAVDGGTPIKGVQLNPDDLGILNVLVELKLVLRDDVSDDLSLTMAGREKIGLRPEGLPDLPVDVEAITGDIREQELAARYIDGKIGGCERHIREGTLPENRPHLEYVAAVLGEIAHEFRIGLHLPAPSIEGKVIPYNQDHDTGFRHADNLRAFYEDVHGRNVKAGWWSNIETGEPKLRNLGELLMLFVTEIWEAYVAYRDNANDDKLPDYPGLGVELGDLEIRLADLCGALLHGRVAFHSDAANPGEELFREVGVLAEHYERIRKTPQAVGAPETGEPMPAMDVAVMVDAKLDFNAKRADHKIENRLKDDGKKT